MIQNEEFIQEFVEEARGHVQQVEQALLTKDLLRPGNEIIHVVFRAVHSVKGTAGFFGLKKIVALSHVMENVFGEVRNQRLQLDERAVDALLLANDCLKAMVEDVLNSDAVTIDEHEARLQVLLSGGTAAEQVTAHEQHLSESTITSQMTAEEQSTNVATIYNHICHMPSAVYAIQHGQRLFLIHLDGQSRIVRKTKKRKAFFEQLRTVASVLGGVFDGHVLGSEEEALQWFEELLETTREFTFSLLIASILEEDILAFALEISSDEVEALSFKGDEGGNHASADSEPECFTKPEPVYQPESDACVDMEEYTEPGTELEPVSLPATANQAESVTDREMAHQAEPTEHEIIRNNRGASSADTLNHDARSLRVEDSIRVHVSILNELLNMASEMVLGRNQLLRTLEQYRKTIPGLGPILQNIDRLTSGMQEKVMHTRMQPLSNVFNRFPRLIRDLAKSLHKEMELVIEGEHVELDKSMIEALADPLTHLVRNAADHGLERADERLLAGKPAMGTIKLQAYHEGGYVYIDIVDDGRGMDSERIKAKALEKRLLSEEELQRMSEQEVLKLIFRPGFSTAEQISDLSGRGVGMDVVRTNIEKMGGSIELFSSRGEGSTIRLMLPLTLAIIQSLIVEVGEHTFALPQVNLKEVVTVNLDKQQEERRLEVIQGVEVLRLRGYLLPVIRLADVLGVQSAAEQSRMRTQTDPKTVGADVVSGSNHRAYAGKLRILVLKIGSRTFGIIVDEIVGSEETLVKPLPAFLKDCLCYSGVTIMGDGRTSLILDLEGILRISNIRFLEEVAQESYEDEQRRAEAAVEEQNLLLFACSGVETFALDLSMVARVEEIRAEQIERVGEREYIQFRGDSLRVIRPENVLDVTGSDNRPAKYYVIIPKLVRHPVGVVIHKIYDNVTTKVSLNHDELRLPGIIGSTNYDGKFVLIMNLYELFELAVPEFYRLENADSKYDYQVLLVEDTPFFQKMEKSYLEEAGCRVVLAHNGKEALEWLERQSFDIVVSDIQMPVMDGFELAKRIREHKRLRHLPLIAVTSMTGDSYTRQGIDSGFDYYEAKLDRDRLLQTMVRAIHERRQVSTVD